MNAQQTLAAAKFVRKIAERQCEVIHTGYPYGSSCLDVITFAQTRPEHYGQNYLRRLLSGEYLCDRCNAKRILETSSPKENK